MKDYNHGNFNGVPYKMFCFIEMQFATHFYTVIPYQELFRLGCNFSVILQDTRVRFPNYMLSPQSVKATFGLALSRVYFCMSVYFLNKECKIFSTKQVKIQRNIIFFKKHPTYFIESLQNFKLDALRYK